MKKLRFLTVLAVLVAVIGFNVALPPVAEAQSDTPCTDMWDKCLDDGGSWEYCDGKWCGCMEAKYGYVCEAQLQ